MSAFLNFFTDLSKKMGRTTPSPLDLKIKEMNDKYGTNVIDFISQRPPAEAAPMIDSSAMMAQTNAAAGANNPAAAMLQHNAQAPDMPSIPAMYDPTSSLVGALDDSEEPKTLEDLEEFQKMQQNYRDVADKQAFLQNRQRSPYQPFNFYG